jgi:citrate synthase
VLDILIDGEEVPPLGLRMKSLGTDKAASKMQGMPTQKPKMREMLYSKIWEEDAEQNNPYAAAACYCHGYDVYGDLLSKVTWGEYLYLLFRGELPTPRQAELLERLAIALSNPGPREPSVMAAMCGGVGGSTWASCLSAALAVGAGQAGGGHEIALAYEGWKRYGLSLDKWLGYFSNPSELGYTDIWPPTQHIPGFDPNGVSCRTPVHQTLQLLSHLSPGGALPWLLAYRDKLESKVGYPLSMAGVASAALYDLGFDKESAELLYLLLRLPGAAVHAREQKEIGVNRFPFFRDALTLQNEGDHA